MYWPGYKIFHSDVRSKIYEKYKGRAAKSLGIVQLLCGLASFALFAAATITGEYGGAAGSFDIFCGTMFIAAGCVEIAADFIQKKSLVIACLVMSVFATLLAIALTGNAMFGVITTGTVYIHTLPPEKVRSGLIIESIMVVIGIVEFGVAIRFIQFGCRVTCCKRKASSVNVGIKGNVLQKITPHPSPFIVGSVPMFYPGSVQYPYRPPCPPCQPSFLLYASPYAQQYTSTYQLPYAQPYDMYNAHSAYWS